MKIKLIKDEVFQDYKKISMLIAFPQCSWKCGADLCQNCNLARSPDIEISKEEIWERYHANPITEAFVFAGLEPFDTPQDVVTLVDFLRRQCKCQDDIVIYTGYTREELNKGYNEQGIASALVQNLWEALQQYDNLIIKFGRFIPNQEPHLDPVLGIKLASSNQYAVRLKS